MFFVGARKEETRLILAPKKVKFINYEVDSFISRTNAKRFFPFFFYLPSLPPSLSLSASARCLTVFSELVLIFLLTTTLVSVISYPSRFRAIKEKFQTGETEQVGYVFKNK